MYKIFTLAVAVAVMPLSHQLYKTDHIAGGNVEHRVFSFRYRNIFPACLSPNTNKTVEPYSQDWLGEAQENIRKSEYQFKWQGKYKAYCTPNRRNNLRFFYNDKGFTVEPRTTKIPLDESNPLKRPDEIKYLSLPDWKVKFDLDKNQVGKGFWHVAQNKAEYITKNISIQYLNNDDGMRQNFIVNSPLSKNNELKINFSIRSKLKAVLNNNRLQFLCKKTAVLNYEGLKVWDANGKMLAATIKKNKNNQYSINVNTSGATYPVTIDPISTTPSAMVESNNAGARMGTSVASAGDVNGDGYSDVVVGAYFYNNGQVAEGAFYVFYGSATGMNTTPALMIESNQSPWNLGYSVASAGDVNGDGYSDILVGAPFYSNGESAEGACFIYQGSASGLSSTPTLTLEENNTNGHFGQSVACAGDINGDGYSDIIVGAPNYSNGQAGEGAFFIFNGSASGINSTATAEVESNQASAQFGWSVASAGDVNGDGFSDVIMGARLYDNGQNDEGAFYVYHGNASGINTTPVTTVEGNTINLYLGYSVASAGDVNGDGYSDVIVGAVGYGNGQSQEGEFFVYHGSASGVNSTVMATAESNQTNAGMGTSVACAGDINGDGYSDIIVGVPGYSNGQSSEGSAFLYTGSPTGINSAVSTLLECNQAGALMGSGVASAGDVNGDGYSDIVVGAQGYSNIESTEGAAFVYHGSASGINTTPAAMGEGNQANATMGSCVASAGDVNGDGYSDVIIGASGYDNGQTDEGIAFVYHGSPTGISTTPAATLEANITNANFGFSVSGAGDVNGDGYCDVVVGSVWYNNGQSFEGAIYVYHGSAAGINTTPAAVIESNIAGAELGYSVSGAGDVNGDGYSDVISGAKYFTNGQANEGALFIFHGSATGISTTPAAILESNQANASLGSAVANAGDVNGDGFSDVIAGAQSFTNGQSFEGAIYIYHGSSTGIITTPAAIVESNQAGANFGRSVSGAGDVNGDGYGDVIAGANDYSNGQTNEGAFFVYHGSATGINTTAAAMVESNQANAEMGIAVGCAGDVNGDGYSDVIVGAQGYTNGQSFEGAAFVYHGSPTGINTTAAAIAESNLASANSGWSVSSAGDVNGDGYSDVIVGAWDYSNGQAAEGAFYVYHGNSPGTNKRNNLRLYNTDLTTPINSSNFIFSNFGAGLFAKSFLGKSKGKLVWETRLNYNPYSGTPITNSTFYTSQQVSYTDMGLAGIELKNIINKLGGARYTRLRARIKYNPVTAITGQVYGPWRNVSSILDANNLGILPIELISFKAAWLQKGRTAQLNFVTDKEKGICCFDIEKSLDGFTYTSIGTIPAKNIAGIQSYNFVDNNAGGKKQFYRIKIKGKSGQIDYSNIQQLQNDISPEILVFPNPTTDVLQLQLNHVYDKMNVQIINTAGQMVKLFNDLSVANQSISIPVKDLPAGHYWLRLQSGSEKQVLQFLKQ